MPPGANPKHPIQLNQVPPNVLAQAIADEWNKLSPAEKEYWRKRQQEQKIRASATMQIARTLDESPRASRVRNRVWYSFFA
uniref:HMG box domain-containing protein n=1 Tax=Mycena chlorophos TaxID=658473 RepID=A0ABQ0L6Y0_MYCCL|nr:predicted protein [Mycena chlorophos]